jgi:hypothetical protein
VFIKVVGTSFTEMFAANDWKPFQFCSFQLSPSPQYVRTFPRLHFGHLYYDFDILTNYSSAAEEEIAKQFLTELWRVLKFSMYTSILHVVVIIPVFRGGTLFQTRIIIIHMCSLLIYNMLLGVYFR